MDLYWGWDEASNISKVEQILKYKTIQFNALTAYKWTVLSLLQPCVIDFCVPHPFVINTV